MFKAFEFCIPTRGTKVPSSRDWLHEIKNDGYRGYDWTKHYPWIDCRPKWPDAHDRGSFDTE